MGDGHKDDYVTGNQRVVESRRQDLIQLQGISLSMIRSRTTDRYGLSSSLVRCSHVHLTSMHMCIRTTQAWPVRFKHDAQQPVTSPMHDGR